MDEKFVTRISRNFSKSEITETGDISSPSQYPPVFETEPKHPDKKPRKKGGFIKNENEKPKTQTTEAPTFPRKPRLSMIERAANISNQSTSNQRTSLEGKQRKSMKERKSMSENKVSDPIIDETTIRRLSTKQEMVLKNISLLFCRNNVFVLTLIEERRVAHNSSN